MTILIFVAGFVAAIIAIIGYVTWRDRGRRGSFEDPSISRGALVDADRQAVQGRFAAALAYGAMPPTGSSGHRSRASRG
jgi:hypothetical protein